MKGFTLLEVLVGLGIMALLTAILYTAYTGNLEAIEVVRDQEVVYQTARVVLDRMARDLEAAVVDTASGVTATGLLGLAGAPGEIEGRPADAVDFTSFAHLAWREGSPPSDLCEVGYRLERDEDTGETILLRRQQIVPDGDLASGGESVALSSDVTSLELRYEDKEGMEVEEWDTQSGASQGRLPRLIRVRMTIRGVSGREGVFSTRVHPVLFEAGADEGS